MSLINKIVLGSLLMFTGVAMAAQGTVSNWHYTSRSGELTFAIPGNEKMETNESVTKEPGSDDTPLSYIDIASNLKYPIGDVYSLEWFKLKNCSAQCQKRNTKNFFSPLPHRMKEMIENKGLGVSNTPACSTIKLRGTIAYQCMSSGNMLNSGMQYIGTTIILQDRLLNVYLLHLASTSKNIPWSRYRELINSIQFHD